jgi:hypothetical protein
MVVQYNTRGWLFSTADSENVSSTDCGGFSWFRRIYFLLLNGTTLYIIHKINSKILQKKSQRGHVFHSWLYRESTGNVCLSSILHNESDLGCNCVSLFELYLEPWKGWLLLPVTHNHHTTKIRFLPHPPTSLSSPPLSHTQSYGSHGVIQLYHQPTGS